MTDELKTQLLDAVLPHVPFDGWSEVSFNAAVQDVGCSEADARALFRRGGSDMAAGYHMAGDQQMLAAMDACDLGAMRYSERVAAGVRFRLEAVQDKEVLRKSVTLFAMPIHAGEGAKLIWGTADHIWTKLGDTSDDINWYSKRVILSGVYASTVLFWLGDNSEGSSDTWEFLDRRIGDVMLFEKFKAKARENPVLKPLLGFTNAFFSQIKAPSRTRRDDLPGHWAPQNDKDS